MSNAFVHRHDVYATRELRERIPPPKRNSGNMSRVGLLIYCVMDCLYRRPVPAETEGVRPA